MSGRKATFTGKENIIDAFDSMNRGNNYFYSLWSTDRDIALQWIDKDAEKGREFLIDNLSALEQADNNDLFFLKFHPTDIKGFIDRKTPVISATPVRVCGIDSAERISGSSAPAPGGNDFRFFEAIQTIKQLPDQINTKLNEFDQRLQAIESAEYVDDEPKDMFDKITGLINNPNMIGIIQNIGSMLFAMPSQPKTSVAINGVTDPGSETKKIDEDLLNQALIRLEKVCNIDIDLNLLANFAEENPKMFKGLLNQLRG